MVQRAVKLSKKKSKGDRVETQVSPDADSDLTDEEDIVTKSRKVRINPTATKKSTKK